MRTVVQLDSESSGPPSTSKLKNLNPYPATWKISWASNVSRWQMGFNSAFKGLNNLGNDSSQLCDHSWISTGSSNFKIHVSWDSAPKFGHAICSKLVPCLLSEVQKQNRITVRQACGPCWCKYLRNIVTVDVTLLPGYDVITKAQSFTLGLKNFTQIEIARRDRPVWKCGAEYFLMMRA